MPVITGELGAHGAIVRMLVTPSANRLALLRRLDLPVPRPVSVMAQIDTGSFVTAVMPWALRQLEIAPFTTKQLRTPSTTRESPHEAFVYDVGVTLFSGTVRWEIPSVHVIQCDDFNPDEAVQALIGRDLLQHCVLTLYGPHNAFSLAFH